MPLIHITPNISKPPLNVKFIFQIYHTDDWNILSYHDCRRGDYFIDGDFLRHDSIVMHTQSGKSFFYQLPTRLKKLIANKANFNR